MSKPFDPDWVVAPGETLADWFAERHIGIDVAGTVSSMHGIEPGQLDRLLSGEEPITEQLAEKLAHMTDVSAHFWLALERNYRVGISAGKVKVG